MSIEKFKGRNGQYYFRVKAQNGQIVLQSEGYISQSGINNGINSVKQNANLNSFEIRKTRKDDFYFVMKAKNGANLGTSEVYKSIQGAKNEIRSVISNI